MPRFFRGSFSSKLEKNRAQIRQGAFIFDYDGGCGEVVNAPDCDSGIRGFNSHQPPHLLLQSLLLGYSQAVRQRILIPSREGSNPSSPAYSLYKCNAGVV